MKNTELQSRLTKQIITNGTHGQEPFCEFCRDDLYGRNPNTHVRWGSKDCVRVGGLNNACHIFTKCARAYNRMKRFEKINK